jgi:TonB family protein
MTRSHLGITAALMLLVSLTGVAGLGAQVDPQKSGVSASIWRQPRKGSAAPEDGPVPLETTDPRFQGYFRKVRDRIKATWTYPSAAGARGIEGTVVVEFRIGKNGHLESADVRRSSGATILDEYAIRAVQVAAPFPPVPDDVAMERLTIESTFRYSLTSTTTPPK